MDQLSLINKDEQIGYEKTKTMIGPLWTGKLQNKKFLEECRTILFEKQLKTKNSLWKLLDVLEEESNAPMFFYNTDTIASNLKKPQSKMKKIFEELRKKGMDF